MRMGPLEVTLHRTVRVAEGRTPANLPPSLGRIKLYDVNKYRERCPNIWESGGVFVGLHDNEALWMSFQTSVPIALMVGAGAINALSGNKLGTKLEKDGYLVTPPQPWLDGWKGTDGTVYQFVATAYQKGKGMTVAEQLIGDESRTGGIGLALFESVKPLHSIYSPSQHWGGSAYYGNSPGGVMGMSLSSNFIPDVNETSCYNVVNETSCYNVVPTASASAPLTKSVARAAAAPRGGQHVNSGKAFSEMGLGKGGKIIQKIYDDPYGLDVWKELPTQTRAIYIVHAELLAEITGEPIQKPVVQESYTGAWFGLKDGDKGDVAGSEKFDALKSVGLSSVFAEDTESAKK